MTKTIQVSHSVCTPIRDKVLTATQDFGVVIFDLDCWGEGDVSKGTTEGKTSDENKLAAQHFARVTVSDKQARYAERLLCQCGWFALESKPIDPKLNWRTVGPCSEYGHLARGNLYTSWSSKRRQPRQRPARRRTNARQRRQTRQDGGLLGTLAKWFE